MKSTCTPLPFINLQPCLAFMHLKTTGGNQNSTKSLPAFITFVFKGSESNIFMLQLRGDHVFLPLSALFIEDCSHSLSQFYHEGISLDLVQEFTGLSLHLQHRRDDWNKICVYLFHDLFTAANKNSLIHSLTRSLFPFCLISNPCKIQVW